MKERLDILETDIKELGKELRSHIDNDNEVYKELTTAIHELKVYLAEWRGGLRASTYLVGFFGTIAGILVGLFI